MVNNAVRGTKNLPNGESYDIKSQESCLMLRLVAMLPCLMVDCGEVHPESAFIDHVAGAAGKK